jgi:hypothetical protein
VASLALVVEDGDDAPINLQSARAVITVPDLFLAAPEGTYTLLVGQPGASPARYELARARDLVFSVAAATLEAGRLEENPVFAAPPPESRTEQYALWAVLALAVLTLTALTLRLARREDASEEAKPGAGGEPKPAPKQKPAPEQKPEH